MDHGDAGFGTMVGRSEGTEIFDGGRVLFAECNVVDLVQTVVHLIIGCCCRGRVGQGEE